MKGYLYILRVLVALTCVTVVLAAYYSNPNEKKQLPTLEQTMEEKYVTKEEFYETIALILRDKKYLKPAYTDEQLNILALIIYQEAGADYISDDTRRKVGSVFLNRVKSDKFPNTFKEVALQDGQYANLSKTGIVWPERALDEEEWHAVDRAYKIARELLKTGSILPDKVIYQAEFTQGEGVFSFQDGIYFCY